MMKSGIMFLFISTLVFGLMVDANATLYDRGGGLIFDSDQNITWLQNANYAMTSGLNSDGQMSWYTATDWLDNLTYYDSIRDVYYSDWRLPFTPQPVIDGYGTSPGSYPGQGYGVTSSEMGYMYYKSLGGVAMFDEDGKLQTPGITKNIGLFDNLNTGLATYGVNDYWSSGMTEVATGTAWTFDFNTGYQVAGINKQPLRIGHFAWAVRDGDVVPEPSTMLLLGTGLIGLAGWSRKKFKKNVN